MAQKKQAKRKISQSSYPYGKVIGYVAAFFFMILATFRLEVVGRLVANIGRFFVGDTDIILYMMLLLVMVYTVFQLQQLKPTIKQIVAVLVCYVNTLLLWQVLVFHPDGLTTTPFNEFLTRASSDFFSIQLNHALGGGLIGALLYASTNFLFSTIGTYMIVFLFYIIVAILLFNTDLKAVVAGLREKSDATYEQIRQKREEKKQETKEMPTTKRTTPSFFDKVKQTLLDEENVEQVVETQDIPVDLRYVDYPEDVTNTVSPIEPHPAVVEPVVKEVVTTATMMTQLEDDEDLEDFDITEIKDDSDYELPPLTLLNPIKHTDQTDEKALIRKNIQILEQTFKSFGVDVQVMPNPMLGPAVTKYELKPAVGVKVSRIVNLSDDIALALAAKDIRMEAPIPGKPYVGIEVPNQTTSFVSFSDVIQASLQSDKPLDVPLGRDISGNVRLCDLTKMPHMLIAGSTGSGKSVCINGIITSILMKTKPHEVKLMMVDPKMVELNVYNGIPHLLTPVVTNPRKAAQALQKVVSEMERRYELFAAMGMRNIDGYNAHVAQYNLETGENNPTLPYIVVIVDELADLMMVASNEVEDAIIRLAQMARAAGIHMILATQRPSVDVITGIIKANVPSRIAFAVSSGTDSRTIIDSNGAEKLLGRGDMLYMPMGENKPIRVQGAYLADDEVERVVDFVKNQQEAEYDEQMMPIDTPNGTSEEPEDDLFFEAVELLKELETVSTSYLQRKFRIGYNRAARLIDELEARGYIGASEGSKPRKVNVHVFFHMGVLVKSSYLDNLSNKLLEELGQVGCLLGKGC